MANGNDDPIIPMPTIQSVGISDGMSSIQPSEGSVLTIDPSFLETDAEEFRTQQSERMAGLVQDLASARVDAARERERIREQAARDANARLIATLGSAGLTQALSGVDVGAQQQTQQATQQLSQQQEAERKAEVAAEEVEETAPVQADIKSEEIVQQDKQQAQKQAAQNRRQKLQIVQSNLNNVNEAIGAVQDAQAEQTLMDRQHDLNMEMARLESRLALDQIQERGEQRRQTATTRALTESSPEELGEQAEAWQRYSGTLGTVQDLVTQAYRGFNEEEGGFTESRGGQAQAKLNSIRRRLEKQLDELNQAKNSLREQGIAIPNSVLNKEGRISNIAGSIAGLGSDATGSTYEQILRQFDDEWLKGKGEEEPLAQWSPSVSDAAEAMTNSQDSDGGGTEDPSGSGGTNPFNRYK